MISQGFELDDMFGFFQGIKYGNRLEIILHAKDIVFFEKLCIIGVTLTFGGIEKTQNMWKSTPN